MLLYISVTKFQLIDITHLDFNSITGEAHLFVLTNVNTFSHAYFFHGGATIILINISTLATLCLLYFRK